VHSLLRRMQLLRHALHQVASKLAICSLSKDVLFAKPPVRSVATTVGLLNFSRWGTKKAHRKVKIALELDMTDPEVETALAPLRASVKEQVSSIWMQSRNYSHSDDETDPLLILIL